MVKLKTPVPAQMAGRNLQSLIRASALVVLLVAPMRGLAVSRDVLLADASSQAIQNTRADTDDLSRMHDTVMLRRFVRTGYLVSLPSSSRFYYLHAIPPAYRYARPWTKLFLERLSRQYYAKFKQRLRITSAVRTAASQMMLARYNGNAADAFGSRRSSHLTGASLDISKRLMSPQGRRWMRNVMYSLRNQGYVYAIEEFEQPAFHVMVYRNYADYVKRLSGKALSKPAKPTSTRNSRVTAVRVINRAHWARIVVQLDGPVSYTSGHLPNPERVYFDLQNTVLGDGVILPAAGQNGPIAAVRIAQFSTTATRIVVEVRGRGDCSSFVLPNPDRFIIDVRLAGNEQSARSAQKHISIPGDHVTARTDVLPSHLQLIRTLGLQVHRVVIDAGHGGHDTGTVGPHGAKEKDIVLGIALRLGRLLKQSLGLEVVYTRTHDTFIPLQERTAIANRAHADLFVSIHANSSQKQTVRGIETYYLDFAATPNAMAVAARENQSSPESVAGLQQFIKQIAYSEKSDESRLLAASVDAALYQAVSGRTRTIADRGVKTAPFVVLIGANMPSILVETAFLSNSEDEQNLRSGAYRQKVAVALLRGISAYLQSLGDLRFASVTHSTGK